MKTEAEREFDLCRLLNPWQMVVDEPCIECSTWCTGNEHWVRFADASVAQFERLIEMNDRKATALQSAIAECLETYGEIIGHGTLGDLLDAYEDF